MVMVDLLRVYSLLGTNGEIRMDGERVCDAIELPWKDNARNISCIPEGKYPLAKRYSKRFGWHILVKDVPGRSGILIHLANNAMKELRGCIAPVTRLTGPGRRSESRKAFEKLKQRIYQRIDENKEVYLRIKTKEAK